MCSSFHESDRSACRFSSFVKVPVPEGHIDLIFNDGGKLFSAVAPSLDLRDEASLAARFPLGKRAANARPNLLVISNIGTR